MLCTRRVLPLLALCVLLEEISAAVLPSISRSTREVSWLDQDRTRFSVGDAEDADGRPPHPEVALVPAVKHQNQNQNQYQRRANDRRRKVAPLDSIGGFQMSSLRSRKDEQHDIFWEEYSLSNN